MTKDKQQHQLAETGGRIRALRETRGLNLHELARLCGISASALSLIETGKRDLRISSLYRIADALRVAAGDLLERQKEEGDAPETDHHGGYDLGEYT